MIWNDVKRPYSLNDVKLLRGSLKENCDLAKYTAQTLRLLLERKDYTHAMGAVTGNQAMQMVKGGFRQISTKLGRLHADVDRRYGGILSSNTRARRHDCRQQYAEHHSPSVCLGRHEPPRRGLKKVLRSSTKSSGCSIAAK